MKFTMKRMLSALLAVVMVLTMVPATAVTTDAAAVSGLSDASIGLDFTAASNGGTVSWSAAGSNITGTVSGVMSGAYYKAEQSTLTVTNKKATAAKLTFSYTVTVADGSVAIDGQAVQGSGTYETELAGGASITITLSVTQRLKTKGQNKAEIKITDISLTSDANATTTFLPGEGGSYTVTDAAGAVKQITSATQLSQHSSNTYTLVATESKGYVFYGWYNETAQKYFAYTATATFQTDSDCTVKPVFISEDSAIFEVGGMKFTNLTEAGNYAKEKGFETVVLTKSGTITGSHTVPAGVTLLIPFDEAYTVYKDVPGMTGVTLNAEGRVAEAYPWEQPYAYATLTLASGAKITVNGAISVGGEHYASSNAQGGSSHCGSPSGPVGFIKLQEESEIVLNKNAALYAWGYVTGAGTVTAKSGAVVRENIQFTDYSGGSFTMGIAATHSKFSVFPMSQYYVQNVEAKLVLESGAKEYVHTALYVPSAMIALSAGVEFIGATGMFRSNSGGSIVKQYLPEKDRLQIDIAGGGAIHGLGITLDNMSADTSSFVLPITNNVTINILSGVTTINQDMALLPGAEVTIAKGAELVLSDKDRTIVNNGEEVLVDGCNLYIYDLDQWQSNGAFDPEANVYVPGIVSNFVYPGKKIAPLPYSPSRTYNRTEADLKDAILDINGTFTVKGHVYTSAGGAVICSSQNSGVISMVSGRAEDYKLAQKTGEGYYTWQAVQTDKVYFANIPVTSAKLYNSNGSYTETEDVVAGDKYIWNKDCGMWMKNYTGGHQNVRGTYVEATCEEAGYLPSTCRLCGKVTKTYDSSDPAKGHKNGEVVIVPGSDESHYYEVTYCTVCNKETNRVRKNAEGYAILGDVNGDEEISVLDAMLVAQYIVGDIDETGMNASVADVNGDEEISVLDAMLIAQFIVGDIEEFPVN